MHKILYSLISILTVSILFSSCYMYDGPTRIIKNVPRVPLPPYQPKKETKAEYLNRAYQDIKKRLPDAQVVLIEDSIKVLFPDNIRYRPKELYPSDDYQMPLYRFSNLLKKYAKTNILVTGHTDSKGNETKNKEISTARAKNIKNILMNSGIGDQRLSFWGLGSVSPIADNKTLEGRDRNRRVEFVVLYDEDE